MERKAIQVAHCAFKFRVAKLSMARLNKASSRTCLEICRRVRIAQVKLLKVLDRHPELLNEVRMTRLENAGWFTPSGFFSWRMSGIAGGMECHLKYWRQAIALLVEAWPEQAKVAGFKGQTPLMLVADRGNATLTQLKVVGEDEAVKSPNRNERGFRGDHCSFEILARMERSGIREIGATNAPHSASFMRATLAALGLCRPNVTKIPFLIPQSRYFSGGFCYN